MMRHLSESLDRKIWMHNDENIFLTHLSVSHILKRFLLLLLLIFFRSFSFSLLGWLMSLWSFKIISRRGFTFCLLLGNFWLTTNFLEEELIATLNISLPLARSQPGGQWYQGVNVHVHQQLYSIQINSSLITTHQYSSIIVSLHLFIDNRTLNIWRWLFYSSQHLLIGADIFCSTPRYGNSPQWQEVLAKVIELHDTITLTNIEQLLNTMISWLIHIRRYLILDLLLPLLTFYLHI